MSSRGRRIFISDLHFGLGHKPDGKWSPKEDFRWTDALSRFLEEMSKWSSDRLDLIIVGDFLELWQPPDDIKCIGSGAGAGCTAAEMVKIAQTVIAAHAQDFALLKAFAIRGENRLHLIPGNHDSALLLPGVWDLLAAELDAKSGRVSLVSSGVWVSDDGRIVAEHGHQIGSDVNKYGSWPNITSVSGGTTYVERPWGERFVQRIFNSQEEVYEIIDNISPETVGVKYRIADRGLANSAADIAQFIAFNLFETSVGQKIAALGKGDTAATGQWDLSKARNDLQYRLFLEVLTPNDPARREIESAGSFAESLRGELSALAQDQSKVSDSDIQALCDQLSILNASVQCELADAGGVIESQLYSRQHVLREHLVQRKLKYPRVLFFVYGHTHEFEKGWQLSVDSTRNIKVHNTGAFQRTIDEAGFLSLVKNRNLTEENALRTLKLEDLPPCYSFVRIKYDEDGIQSETLRWHVITGGAASVVEPGDSKCKS